MEHPVFDYCLKDFFIGYNDGKSEATYTKDFERFFYDYNGILEEVLNPRNFLVLGRKGTGKTILAQYIEKKASSDPCWFFSLSSCKDFRFENLISLENKDLQPNEFMGAWEWIILLQFCSFILKDQSLSCDSSISGPYEKIKQFIGDNFANLPLHDTNKVVETTKQRKFNLNFKCFEGSVASETKSVASSKTFLDYIDTLRALVFEVIQRSTNRYDLMIDELDDRFRDQPVYKDSIISLIKAVQKINHFSVKAGVNSKVTIFLRTDIYDVLNDPDLNKIRIDNTIEINWTIKTDRTSPILALIFLRVRQSVPALASLSDDILYNVLFPEKLRDDADAARYILERTFFRPRDMITFLNLVVKAYPSARVFGRRELKDIEGKYSSYFLDEARNELIGHLSEESIRDGFQILKQLNKKYFCFKELEQFAQRNQAVYGKLNLRNVLSTFFSFGIIGNRWDIGNGRFHYAFTHRDHRIVIDFDKEIVLHLGIRDALTL